MEPYAAPAAPAHDNEQRALHDLHATAEFDPIAADSAADSQQATPSDSPALSPVDAEDDLKPALPIQKRRRVTRACDECRRKKIKCDGKQSCTHCTVYGYECTYDQPSNRRRNAAPRYIDALEKQLARANAILKSVVPLADLNDPELEVKLQQGLLSPSGASATVNGNGTAGDLQRTTSLELNSDSHLESMVKATGQLDLDEQGHLEYHGHSSGLSFMKRLREQLGEMMGPEGQATPFQKARPLSQVFDSPRSTLDSPWERDNALDLPPKEVTRTLCDNAVEDAGALLRVVHYPTFLRQLDDIYDIPHDHWTNEENVFLPLLYSVMALGILFSKDETLEIEKKGYESAIAEGFKYFRLARSLMDIADCRDLRHIQALVFMIMFLQSSARLSTCYGYIGVALRAALRMGLHRSFADGFSPIEAETRKRLFWVIQRLDTYVGAILGLPHSLSEDDIDQELPVEVDDEFITANGIAPQPANTISIMAAANAHIKLIKILDKTVRYVYPLKGSGTNTKSQSRKSYSVSYSKILEIERDLKNWQDNLPMDLKPGGAASPGIIRAQHLLRMAYAHAQMMLYRPFLHYVSHTCKSRAIDKRSYACAAACVSVSRNIVHIALEMKKKGLLVGAYWFTMYTAFFAILSLVFYALENPENDASQDVLRVATEGKELLEQLTKRSMAADRCAATLQALFEQLPERMRKTRRNSTIVKKRKQEMPTDTADQSGQQLDATVLPRANTVPHARSQSVDRKQNTLPYSSPQVMTMDPTNSRTTNFYDLSAETTVPPSPLSASVSQTQAQDSEPISPVQGDANPQAFPLADLSAMMFPSADPIAYPNQIPAPAQNYDEILKQLGTDPSFAFPPTLDEYRLQRAVAGSGAFVPPSSTFVYTDAQDPSQLYNGDVQLLGPMPAYLMQGAAFNQQLSPPPVPATPQTQADFPPYTPDRNAQFPPPAAQPATPVPMHVNLDALLGAGEWTGLHATAYSNFSAQQGLGTPSPLSAGARGSPVAFVGDGNGGVEGNGMVGVGGDGSAASSGGRGGGGGGRRVGVGSRAVTFEDLNPAVLGWNLDGY